MEGKHVVGKIMITQEEILKRAEEINRHVDAEANPVRFYKLVVEQP